MKPSVVTRNRTKVHFKKEINSYWNQWFVQVLVSKNQVFDMGLIFRDENGFFFKRKKKNWTQISCSICATTTGSGTETIPICFKGQESVFFFIKVKNYPTLVLILQSRVQEMLSSKYYNTSGQLVETNPSIIILLEHWLKPLSGSYQFVIRSSSRFLKNFKIEGKLQLWGFIKNWEQNNLWIHIPRFLKNSNNWQRTSVSG